MNCEFKVIKGDVNSGEVIRENGYKNVLIIAEKLVEDFGNVEVRILITKDIEDVFCEVLLDILRDEIEGYGFLAWFPLNKNKGCVTTDNLELGKELSESFCIDLMESYGLEVISEKELNDNELEAA